MTDKKKTLKMTMELYPKIFKGLTGKGEKYIRIIYMDHSEYYVLNSEYSRADAKRNGTTYKPDAEEDMELGNGAKRVHGHKEVQVWEF